MRIHVEKPLITLRGRNHMENEYQGSVIQSNVVG